MSTRMSLVLLALKHFFLYNAIKGIIGRSSEKLLKIVLLVVINEEVRDEAQRET